MSKSQPILRQPQSSDWATPIELFAEYDALYHFTLDVCSSHALNWQLCPRFYSPYDNGLHRSWQAQTCWMNPPYGREIAKWVRKAHLEWIKGNCTIVALLPARTDMRWFHDYVLHVADLEFLQGRVRFSLYGVERHPAPFPSVIAIYRGENHDPWR